MVNEIVLAIDPALRKIEDILLWKNKFKTAAFFTFFHFLFWLFQSFNIRTFCTISCLILLIHSLDAYRAKKRRELIRMHSHKNIIEKTESDLADENFSISSLGRWIIYCYSKSIQIFTSLRRLKQRNRFKYFFVMLLFWSLTAIIGIKIRGFYLGYILFWIMFVVPAILHYDIPRKVLRKAMPILEQLDHSMKYERRSILDKKELLVDVKLPSSDLDDLEQEDEYLKSFQLDEIEPVKPVNRSRQIQYEQDDDDDDEEEEEEEEDVNEEEDDDDEEGEEIEEEFEYESKRIVYKEQDQEEIDDGYDEQIKKASQTSLNKQRAESKKLNVDYDLNIDDDDDDLNSLIPDGSLPNINDITNSIIQSPDKYDQVEDYSMLKNAKVVRRKAKNRPSLLDYYGDSIRNDVQKVEEAVVSQRAASVTSRPSSVTQNTSSANWKYSSNSPVSSASSSSSLLANQDIHCSNKMIFNTQTNNLMNEPCPKVSYSSRKSANNEQDIDETFDFLDEELNKYDN